MSVRTAAARWQGDLVTGKGGYCPVSRLLSPGAEITLSAELV
ncbi:MAG TPA: hypothetical protein VFG35_05980 [Actinoplanes sp.]|nr:hypothetical protein [Actinoplanes sp.]